MFKVYTSRTGAGERWQRLFKGMTPPYVACHVVPGGKGNDLEPLFEHMSYWSSVTDDPNASDIRREFARIMTPIPKIVVLDKLTRRVSPWLNTRIETLDDAHREIAALEEQPGKDIFIYGSLMLWNDLLNHGLLRLHAVVVSLHC